MGTDALMDAITLLKNDHKTVEKLFKQYEGTGDSAYAEKRRIVDRIIEELSVHAAVEEQLFYPVARLTVADTEDIALESIEEHHIVKWELSELEDLDPADERFNAKVTVLMENVRHHVKEEEEDFFPKVRDELGRNDLSDLGDTMVEAKKIAPTHPHPTAPDSPPANLLAGPVAGTMDKVADTAKGIAQGSVSAAQDFAARLLHRRSSSSAPTGSSTARRQAAKVRSGASDAVDAASEKVESARSTAKGAASKAKRTASTAQGGVKKTVGSAKTGATKTAGAAKSGAKGTATSARRSAKSTATTAKRATTTTRRTARKSATSTAATAKRAAKKTAAVS